MSLTQLEIPAFHIISKDKIISVEIYVKKGDDGDT